MQNKQSINLNKNKISLKVRHNSFSNIHNAISEVSHRNTIVNIPQTQENDIYSITNKFISNEEWEVISNLLSKCPNYHTLSLSGINIDGFGLKKLSELISINKHIKTLKLEWNYLNEYAAEFDILCESISSSNSLMYLLLNNNKLSSNHIKPIVKMIQKNVSLVQIDLKWNELVTDNGKEILNALNSNEKLQEINLTGNSISTEVISDIIDKLTKNKNMTYKANLNKENSKISKYNDIAEKLFPPKSKDANYHQIKTYINYFKSKDNDDDIKNLLEKEKDLTNEYKARYDSQLVNNANLEKKVRELEILFGNEKANNEEFKNKHTKEMQIEKEKNMHYENEIIKIKDEFAKKEFEWKKKLIDTEKEITKNNQEKHDIVMENNIFEEEIKQLKEIYEEKNRKLAEQYSKLNSTIQNNYESLKLENMQLRKNFEEEIKNLQKENDKKLKSLEEFNKSLRNTNENLERELSIAKRELNDIKFNNEFEAKERESKFHEEETRKIENLIKQYENKFKTYENVKEELNDKQSKIQIEIDHLRKTLFEESASFGKAIDKLNEEKRNLEKTNFTLTSTINKLNSDITIAEGMNNKLKIELNEVNNLIQSDRNLNTTRIDQIFGDFNREKIAHEKERQGLLIKLSNLQFSYDEAKSKLDKQETLKIKQIESLKLQISKEFEERFKEKFKV